MRIRLQALSALLFVVLVAAGCQKLSNPALVDETISVPSLESKSKIIAGPKKDQKVSITAQSAEGNFDLYVVFESDAQRVMDELSEPRPVTGNVLGKKTKTKDVSLDVSIPAGSGFAVIVLNSGPKEVSIKMKVTNVP
jgi:hypothetical protein